MKVKKGLLLKVNEALSKTQERKKNRKIKEEEKRGAKKDKEKQWKNCSRFGIGT